jgi:hypothetical protein
MGKANRKKGCVALVVIFTVGALLAILFANTAINRILSLTYPNYIIPKESSFFSFKLTMMNSKSGGWRIYGKDDKNFYYFTEKEVSPYKLIPIAEANEMPGFVPHNFETWGSE